MEFVLRIKMDNSAFSGTNGTELAHILRRVANVVQDEHIEPDEVSGPLTDTNGNYTGFWSTKTGGTL